MRREPWPGSQWPTCVSSEGCPAFDLLSLTPFSQRVIAGIRKADRRLLVWYAPNVTFDFGARSWHGDTGDPRAGFAFNMYCLHADPLRAAGLDSFADLEERSCEVTYERTLTLAEEHSQATDDALLLTEFGATDRLETVEQVVEAADDQMLSWQQWAYWNADPSGETPDHGLIRGLGRPPRGENVKRAKLRVSARPYPRAIAGTPREFDFDRERKLFELRYSTRRADGAGRFPPGSITEVFVPRLHYPSGYDVRVKGARPVSRTRAQILRLVSRPGAKVVRLRLTRNGRG